MVRDDGGTHAGRVAARIALGIVLVALAVGGLVAAAAGSALGGGIVVAGLVIACGVGLVGGAFRGGARWLIVPALVLALPLGAVAATDLDVRGTWGERTFHPRTVAELERGYEMGLGAMKVDVRDVELPPGRTDLPLEIGMGEIQVLVPRRRLRHRPTARSAWARSTSATASRAASTSTCDEGPAAAPGVRELHLVADLGVGALLVGNDFFEDHGPRPLARRGFDSLDAGTNRLACLEAGMTPRPGYDPASLIAGVIVIVLGGLLLLDQADVLELAASTCCRPCSPRSAASCSPAGSPGPPRKRS